MIHRAALFSNPLTHKRSLPDPLPRRGHALPGIRWSAEQTAPAEDVSPRRQVSARTRSRQASWDSDEDSLAPDRTKSDASRPGTRQGLGQDTAGPASRIRHRALDPIASSPIPKSPVHPPPPAAGPGLKNPAQRTRASARGSVIRQPLIFTPRKSIAYADEQHSEDEDEMRMTGRKSSNDISTRSGKDNFTRAVSAPEDQPAVARRPGHRSTNFNALVALSKQHGIALADVKTCAEEFRDLDDDMSEFLTIDEFEGAIRKRCALAPNKPLPQNLKEALLLQADTDRDGTISFEEFLLWTRQCNFVEEMAVTSPEERSLRQLARDVGLDFPHIEKLRRLFVEKDTDKSGIIEYSEYKQLLIALLKVKDASDISEPKLKRYWSEAVPEGMVGLDFQNFLRWYCEKFFDPDETDNDPESAKGKRSSLLFR